MTKVTRKYIKQLQSNARGIKKEFDAKIREKENFVDPKIASLNEEYDDQIVESAKKFEKHRLPVQKEIVKLEKSRDQSILKIGQYKLEAKFHAERDDSVGEQKWKERSREKKKGLSEIKDRLKQAKKELRDLEDRRSLEIFKMRSELEDTIKDARKDLVELESSRDAQILILKQEIETYEKQTKIIIDQLGRMTKLRETAISQFDTLGVKRDLESKNIALFYVPFYIACFIAESEKRYLVFPPSTANTIGFSTRLKSALGRKKIKQLLLPRFHAMNLLKETIQVLTQQDAAFETEIRELGQRTNLLNKSMTLEGIKKGLSSIQKEGWISTKEYEALSKKIGQSEGDN
jgi:hypothetical protein